MDRVIARVRAAEGDVALFAHGHVLRVLGARWIGLPAGAGQHFLLDTGTLCVLGYYRDDTRREDLERAAHRLRRFDRAPDMREEDAMSKAKKAGRQDAKPQRLRPTCSSNTDAVRSGSPDE